MFLHDDTLQYLEGFCAGWTFHVLQPWHNLGQRFGASRMHLSPPPPPVAWAAVHSRAVVLVVVDLLFIVTPIVRVCNCSVLCCTLLYVHSSFAIILMGKRELVALLSLSYWCLVIVV